MKERTPGDLVWTTNVQKAYNFSSTFVLSVRCLKNIEGGVYEARMKIKAVPANDFTLKRSQAEEFHVRAEFRNFCCSEME